MVEWLVMVGWLQSLFHAVKKDIVSKNSGKNKEIFKVYFFVGTGYEGAVVK